MCGGGPTGVEADAEIYDLCQEDVMRYYPKICREEVSIHVIQSREHILNTVSRPSIDRLTTEYRLPAYMRIVLRSDPELRGG